MSTVHYLYFPTNAHAIEAAQRLRSEGRVVKLAQSTTDEDRVLCTVVHKIASPEEIAEIGDHLTQIAAEFGGEYDGSEVHTEEKGGPAQMV